MHEAAHLAIAELYPCTALEVHAVSIADAGPFAGGLIADAPDLMGRRELRSLIAVLLAGFEAEWHFSGEPAFEHATTDLRQAYVLTAALADHARSPVESLWREIQTRVRIMLLRHWSAVEHLAVELVRETVVDGDRARAIVRGCVPREVRYCDGLRLPPPLPRRAPTRGLPPPPPGIVRAVVASDSGARMR